MAAVVGLVLVAAGAGLVVWGYRHHGTWLEGENSPAEGHYSVHRPPSAPGIKRMAIGVVFIIVGVILLAPSVTGFWTGLDRGERNLVSVNQIISLMR